MAADNLEDFVNANRPLIERITKLIPKSLDKESLKNFDGEAFRKTTQEFTEKLWRWEASQKGIKDEEGYKSFLKRYTSRYRIAPIIENRFDYIKQRLKEITVIRSISFPAYILTTFLTDDGIKKLQNGDVPVDLKPPFNSERSLLFEKIELLEFMNQLNVSREWKKLYESGDENAIFEYCKQNEKAFRQKWVHNQIELWRQENTPSSRNNLKKLMSSYIDARGKTSEDHLIEYMLRDKEIFNRIIRLNAENSKLTIEECIDKAADSLFFGRQTVKEIYREYSTIRRTIRELACVLRGKPAGLLPKSLPYRRTDPVVRVIFNLDRFINTLDKELRLFKEMRYIHQRVEYVDHRSLVRKPNGKKKKEGKDIKSIFEEISVLENSTLGCTKDKTGYFRDPFGFIRKETFDYIREVYSDYRGWEAFVNHDNLDEVIAQENLEVV